jgi:hypothetical protein
MSCSAPEQFFYHLNERWPSRNKSNDFVSNQQVIFNPDLDGKKTTAKKFIQDLLSSLKNGLDGQRIYAIVYENKKASSEQKQFFWSWRQSNIYDDGLIHIYFNEEKIKDSSEFNFAMFSKPQKEKKTTIDFPGIKPLQYKRRNKSVKLMQSKLIQQGFLINEKELGYYGKETCEAVKMYYRRNLGINSGTIVKDGKKFGPKAWERLFS